LKDMKALACMQDFFVSIEDNLQNLSDAVLKEAG